MRVLFILALVAMLTVGSCGDDGSSRLRVLAASSLTEVFDDIATEFHAVNPDAEIELIFGGSASLAAQVEAGIDFDVVALADETTMDRIAATGEIGLPTVFATNDALLVSRGELSDTGLDQIERLTVAVCAVEVPCGRAAAELFDTLDIDVEPVTFEANVLGVVTKLTLGEVDAGVIYTSDLLRIGPGFAPLAAAGATVTNRYPAASRVGDDPVGDQFLEFLTGPEAQERLRAAGFGAP